METKYITKFEALEAVGAASCDISCYDYEKIEKEIQDIPAADVRPVVRGEWIVFIKILVNISVLMMKIGSVVMEKGNKIYEAIR